MLYVDGWDGWMDGMGCTGWDARVGMVNIGLRSSKSTFSANYFSQFKYGLTCSSAFASSTRPAR